MWYVGPVSMSVHTPRLRWLQRHDTRRDKHTHIQEMLVLRWIHTKPFNEEWLAKPRAPELSQDPGLCLDAHSSCAQWAAAGECDKNAAYMKVLHSQGLRRVCWINQAG